MVPGELSVSQVSVVLGTSPQTVRALLRKGELRGERRDWGSRYVWVVPEKSVDEFLARYGRLDGRRRQPHSGAASLPALSTTVPRPRTEPQPLQPIDDLLVEEQAPSEDEADEPPATHPPTSPGTGRPRRRGPHRWRYLLRPRVRATIVLVVVGIPILVAYATARVVPRALWFDEVGHADVFRTLIEARVALHGQVLVAVAVIVGGNAVLACRGTWVVRRASSILGLVAVSLACANSFATIAANDVQTYLLWSHRQPFGVVDPESGRDVGFFVFSLPFYLDLSAWLLWLVAVTAVTAAAGHAIRGGLRLRPLRADFRTQLHLAVLAAAFLLVISWRLRLEQYVLELDQPSTAEGESFPGAGYIDVNVRSPLLASLSGAVVVLALACVAAPFIARTRWGRLARLVLQGGAASVAISGVLAGFLAPLLIQRYVVEPSPLVREAPYLARSITATRAALGLDEILDRPYQPASSFDAADFAESRQRFVRLPAWDTFILGARMRQLVTEPPYYRPEDPELDVVTSGGRTQVTSVSARELDLTKVPSEGRDWVSSRLAYTHGLGLVRYSSTYVDADRDPALLDSGLGVDEPRIYYGDLAQPAGAQGTAQGLQSRITLDSDVAKSHWVVANTRRPEVDIPNGGAAATTPYHYNGTGGIALSDWSRRAVFAMALGSKELLLSDEITPRSRLLLHRDVHDRLATLAPFIQWDTEAVPLTAGGRIVFVVDGYTTSDSYPYAQRVALGDNQVRYARASVLATVDAFSGEVTLYITDRSDPLIRAWLEIFPGLFESYSALPVELRGRIRYPGQLFDAQSTAYERFHTTRPDQFVSGADAWSRPLALSGPIEVAGDVDFDESDEDDLRLTMPPVYIYAPPSGSGKPRIVLATYYTPTRGQNLVGSLTGWIDDDGRARLIARRLPRDPVTLGPAQVSRVVFATPRVSSLLGLRNLEIRDLDKSSIDAVLLGRPRIMMLPGGVVQIQNLYEGSRGPGAARLLGVTAYVNGRAGLGRNAESAVRQALNQPPSAQLVVPDTVVVDQRVRLRFRVENAAHEVVRITTASGTTTARLEVSSGVGTVTWRPTERGEARVRVDAAGLDGTRTSAVATVRVLGPAPELTLLDRPLQGMVGRPVRVRFGVENGVRERAEVSTSAGIVFRRRYEIDHGRGVVSWTPDAAGPARLLLEVEGTEGQVVRQRLSFDIVPSTVVSPPAVTLLKTPRRLSVGVESSFTFRADGCRVAVARVADEQGRVAQQWDLPCSTDAVRIAWTPTSPGPFLLTITARGDSSSTQASVPLAVRARE